MEQSLSAAAVEDVLIGLFKEEYAIGTGQRSKYAAVKDVQSKLGKEECALDMELRSSDAAMKDVQILLRKEECALGMEQRLGTEDAAAQVAKTGLGKEEYAGGTVQKSNYAAVKGVQNMQRKEENVGDTGQIAMNSTSLLH